MALTATKTQRIEQLERDLREARQALAKVITILKAIEPQKSEVFYEIGRAYGTAALGLTMSGSSYRQEAVR